MPYITAIIIAVVLGAGYTYYETRDASTTTPIAQVAAADTVASRKDGTYTSEVTYLTPTFSKYQLDVSLSIKNNIVTEATVADSQGAEKDPNAQRFEGAYRAEVIGKDINSLNLSRVGGASLTTGAFNEALAKIKTDAKA